MGNNINNAGLSRNVEMYELFCDLVTAILAINYLGNCGLTLESFMRLYNESFV